jgi:transcriptional regulator with XRE-family HTH domain
MENQNQKIKNIRSKKSIEDIEFDTRVANNLKMLRTQNRLSQKTVADQLGRKDYSAYGKIEQGNTSLSFIDAVKLAKLYNVNLEKILSLEVESKILTIDNQREISENKNKKNVSVIVELNGSEEDLKRQFEILKSINSLIAI